MPTIIATPTAKALEFLPKMWGGLDTFKAIDEFRVGEGGWISSGGGQVPRTPDASLMDLDALVNPGRYPSDSLGTFTKALVSPADFGFVAPGILEVTCFLDFGEFNDDGNGNDPSIYEIGLFSDNPAGAGKIMVAYGTFAEQQKNAGVQLTNTVRVLFAS